MIAEIEESIDRRKHDGPDRVGRPQDPLGRPGEERHYPGEPTISEQEQSGGVSTKVTSQLAEKPKPRHVALQELTQSPNFQRDLDDVARLLTEEKSAGLAVGEIADKWIGDRRYSRLLNADIFADHYRRHTGRDLSGRSVRSYIAAHREDQFHSENGKRFPNLSVGHLGQIAASRCSSDAERLELAERVNSKKATVRQVKTIAARLHAETTQARRTIDVVPTESRVAVMEAHDLLSDQEDGSIECAILDWQWSDREWGRNHQYPKVHTPADPAGHLCGCLEILKKKLAPAGSIFVFFTPVGFLDARIATTCSEVGLQHAGKLIWQKTCGGFQDADTMLRIGHEEIHILCHKGAKPKALNGGTTSVTPKWGAPTHAASGCQLDAVHRHQKPVVLMELLIAISTAGGLVCDPFAGSGSAGVAAVRRGSPYVSSELMPDIAKAANRRIALAKGDNDEVVEALNFFLEGVSDQQYQIITSALEHSGLRCVRRAIGGES